MSANRLFLLLAVICFVLGAFGLHAPLDLLFVGLAFFAAAGLV